jgi:hypothetical protein
MIALEAYRIKNQSEKAKGRSARSTRLSATRFSSHRQVNSHLILADADSIGLSRAGPEFALGSMTKVTSKTQKLTAKADSHP